MLQFLFASLLALLIPFSLYATTPDAMDSLCAATDKNAGFVSGDTIKWETKVLPEFKYVTTHPDFRKLAGDNLAYKIKLESLRINPENIRQRNHNRIIEEARKSNFNKSITSRIQCTRNFVEKKLPLAVDNFIGCLQPYNRKYCGEDFQTNEGIKKNLDVIKKVDKQFNQMITAAYGDPAQAEFMEDIKDSYTKFALKVKEAQEKFGLELEKAKERELTENKNEYARVTKKVNGLEDAEKVFGRCRSYLKKEGFESFENEKQILGQVSDCTQPGSPTEQATFHEQMKSFEKVGEDLQRQSMLKLATDMYGFTLEHTKKSYLQSYYKVHGTLPTLAQFEKATGKSPKDSQFYSAAAKEVSGTPVMDIPGEMNKFNAKVKLLNAACKDMSLPAGTRAQRVNEAYSQVLNGTSFGSLMTIKGFKKEIGTFDQDDCLKGGNGLEALTPDDKDKVKSALDKTLDVLGEKGRRLVSDKSELLDPKDPYNGIRYFLKYNPLVVRKMISDNVDPAGAALLCYEIKKIYSDERSHDRWNTALSWASMAGAIVATVLTGGAAAPLMVAALTVGTVNSLNAISYAYVAEQGYMESNVSGTYDKSTAQQQVTKYNTAVKMESVGLVMNFVPMGGKALAKPLLKTSAAKFMMNSQVWKAGAKMTAPMSKFMGKAGTAAGATMDDLLLAVAPKNASKVISSSLREFASGLPEDAAMQFATLTLAYPTPPGVYSEEGMTDLMMGVAMSRGMAVVPAKIRTARFNKMYNEHLGHANGYFDGLSGDQKKAFDDFKREVNFDKMTPEAQEEMILRMHQIHKDNNVAAGEKAKFGKVMDLAKFKQELLASGVSEKVADVQVRNLASEKNKVLGETIPASQTHTASKDYFDKLSGDKKKAFEDFKKSVNYEGMSPEDQNGLLVLMHKTQRTEYSPTDQIRIEEKKNFIEIKNELVRLGVKDKDAIAQVRALANEKNQVLGLSPSEVRAYKDTELMISGVPLSESSFTYIKGMYKRTLDPKEVLYYQYLLENKPGLKNSNIPTTDKTAVNRLAEMRNTTANDAKYLLESKQLSANHAGGEAEIFVNPNNKTEALKVWNSSRLESFDISIKAVEYYDAKVSQNQVLKTYIHVAKIKEKGPDYIVKEFSPNSVELKKVMHDPQVLKAIKAVEKELLKSPDVISQKMYQAIHRKSPSANYHWDPELKKIILIDALGF